VLDLVNCEPETSVEILRGCVKGFHRRLNRPIKHDTLAIDGIIEGLMVEVLDVQGVKEPRQEFISSLVA
jgi:hypothetical protein